MIAGPVGRWPAFTVAHTRKDKRGQNSYGHLDSYNSYAVAAAFGADSGLCVDGSGKCENEKGQRLGTKVHKTKDYETWVYVEKDGSLTIHHVYLLADRHHH